MAPKRVQTFELSDKARPYVPVSTTKILGNFTRDSPPDFSEAAQEELRSEQRLYAETVAELRKWAKRRESRMLLNIILRSIFLGGVEMSLPPEAKLHSTINHFFSPRMDIRVIVCDFGDGVAERHEVRLGDIEQVFETKPSWATVRWMQVPQQQHKRSYRHAPLGVGLVHSSVEALFFHTGSKTMGRPFTKAGRAGWPYLEIEMLDLRNAQHIRDSRDLLRILKTEKHVNDVLDRGVFAGNNSEKLRKDIIWRAQYVGQSVNFWELAKSDLPWQISEGSHLNMNGPSEGVRTTKLENVSQSLARHAYYKDAYIARSPFRCFHRSDGFLLTMSPAAGVNYLNTNLPYYLNMSREELAESNFASVFAQVFKEFSETGTDTWYRKDVEWFLVYLITEIGTTPHNIRQGYSVPSLMDAYDAIVHELKERRYDPWQRSQTINLVRAYLVCIDELNILGEIFTKKLDFFRRLKEDCDGLDLQDNAGGDPPQNENGETPADRIAFAQNMMEESRDQCKRLNADLRESLNSLFQLRSIEQNELAIMADTQHKAIFVFTAVTIIFLPLSFFTSYFGMNLQGVVNTDRTESYFWKVGGSVSFCLVLFTCLWAFRYRMQHETWASRLTLSTST